MKKLGLAMALALLPLLAFAGGSKESGGGDNNYMRLTWWGNTVRDERTIKVAELYQSKNPGVVIDTETTGWGGYWDKVNTQAAAGSIADLMQQDFAYIAQWAQRGQLLDLTPYINQGVIDTSKISESALSSGKIDGKMYAISLGTNAFGIAYDPAILRQAGVTIDSKNWTWKDFENIATTIYEKTGVKTLPFSTVDPSVLFENFIRQTGASVYAPDGKKLGYTETATLEEFWNIQLRLLDKGVLLSPDEAFITVSIEEDPFSQGKSWVQYIWSNQIAATANGIGKPIEMAFCPRLTSNYKRPGTYLKPSQFFSITAKAENPDLAAKVLNFYLNDLEANDILLAERGVPIPDDVRDHLYPKMDATQKIAFTFISDAGDYTSPIDPPDPAAAGEIRAIFRDTTVQVLNKTLSPKEGATRLMTRANQLLAN